jgi:hypothetical protein
MSGQTYPQGFPIDKSVYAAMFAAWMTFNDRAGEAVLSESVVKKLSFLDCSLRRAQGPKL